jgi:hypothetical protein
MSTETLDGTIESATVKQSNAKVSIYDAIVIRRTDGSERRLEKVAVAPSVVEMLQPGVQGRFYTYKALDHRGVVAARTKDGRSAFAIPSGNERIMMMAAIVGLAWTVVMLLARGGVPILGMLLGVGGALGWFSYRKTRIESKARFDADGGYAG